MHDFVIIGSGVSGGRIAFELSRGGARCLLLEAGRAYDRSSFPAGEMAASAKLFWGGGIEVSKDARFGFLRGKCLGGTSVVNQADLDRFDDMAFDAFRDRSGVSFFTAADFDPVYRYLEDNVAMGEIPRQYWNQNALHFARAFDARGYHWKPIVRSQTDCRHDQGSDCIVCLGGCPRDAKQSTLVTCIPQARELGLEVETEFEVDHLAEEDGAVRVRGRQRDQEREVSAAKCILAAGAFGNTRILWRSNGKGSRLPALGRSFCCHPQYMTFGVHDELVDAHKGPLQSVQAHDEGIRRQGIKFENVFAGPIATAMLLPGVGREHLARMRQLRHLACIEVAVMDEPTGNIHITPSGKVVADKKLTGPDREKIRRGLEMAIDLHNAAGAREIIRCDQGFGLHLMGGCPIGVDDRTSVVGPDFRVHGYCRVYAADSSIYPTAPGINPSFTIMALSVMASRMFLAR